jgi:hypothetical protein
VRHLVPLALLGAVAALTPPGPASAQGFLDQGVFVIARRGSEIGREEFAIRTTTGRQGLAGVLSVATIRIRDRELKAALELTNSHAPVSYQLDVTTAGHLTERLSGQFGHGRCAVRVVNQSGEVAREFAVPPGVVVLDDDAFHQFYFVPRPGDGARRSITILRPRETAVVAAEVRSLGPDTVVVGDRSVPAEHYVLTLLRGEAREFWFSTSGDLLKVSLPANSSTATRLSLPAR